MNTWVVMTIVVVFVWATWSVLREEAREAKEALKGEMSDDEKDMLVIQDYCRRNKL